LIRLFPEGFSPLPCPAVALPALLPVPAVPPAAFPVVVPPVGDPVVVPLAAAPPVELPPAAPPVDCANAQVPVNASAVANPIAANFMIVPFMLVRIDQRAPPPLRSRLLINSSLLFPIFFSGNRQRHVPTRPLGDEAGLDLHRRGKAAGLKLAGIS
jgi:hypothetical protein